MRAERRTSALAVAALTVFIVTASGVSSPVLAVPLQFTVQGRLTDANGVNRDGAFTITARLWSEALAGTLLYKETKTAVPVVNGNFALLVGGAPDLDSPKAALDQVFTGAVVYLEFQAAGETPMVPRQPLLSVPYAIKARSAADSAPGPSVGLQTTIGAGRIKIKADFVSVDGAGFRNVSLDQPFAPTGTGWHSVNLVSDAPGAAVFICVVGGSLSAGQLSQCGASAAKFRRVGWARPHPGDPSRFAGIAQSGEWWNYTDVDGGLLAIHAGLLPGIFEPPAIPPSSFMPPGTTQAIAWLAVGRVGAPLVMGICWRRPAAATQRCFFDYGGGTEGSTGAVQWLHTDESQRLEIRVLDPAYSGSGAVYIIGYQDPV